MIIMKKFYQVFNGGSTLWNQLSWSHNRLIMNIDDDKRRNFYLEECIKSNWSVRQLERQINSFYYERLISTKEPYKEEVKNEINILEKKDKIENFIKDPYVLEFLDIKEKEDNPTIGIILCSDKKDTIVKYSVLNDNN